MKNLKLRNIAQELTAIIVMLFSFSALYAATFSTGYPAVQAKTVVENIIPDGAQSSNSMYASSNSKINRAKKAFLSGPTIKGLKIVNHKFNFWKTVKVTKKGKYKIVTGRFSYDKKWRPNPKYYFTATFDSKGKLIKMTRKIKKYGSLDRYIRGVVNKTLGKVPYVGGKVKINDSHLDTLFKRSWDRVKKTKKGKVSWVDEADAIACTLAVAAANK